MRHYQQRCVIEGGREENYHFPAADHDDATKQADRWLEQLKKGGKQVLDEGLWMRIMKPSEIEP